MKQIYFTISILLLLAGNLLAQTRNFEYDAAGNRVKRIPYNAPLPVTLVSFTAVKSESDSENFAAKLNWKTTAEVNSERFDIQRSLNGKDWFILGSRKAVNNNVSNAEYTYVDQSPFSGENYYRLKMIDHDESFAYSQIRSLIFDTRISFYPNPVKDLLKIKGMNAGKIQFLDITGRLVYETDFVSEKAIELKSLSTGIYLIKVLQKSGLRTIVKIVKE